MHTTDITTHRPTSHRSAHHRSTCPAVDGHTSPVAACTVAAHPEQGWSLLCNGVVLFDDGGYLLPASAGTPSGTPTSTAPAAQPVAA
jgi:hypothetical protein